MKMRSDSDRFGSGRSVAAAEAVKYYDDACVLQMPEMIFERGSVTALIGANGSGKSTYARILAGIVRPDKPMAAMRNGGTEAGHISGTDVSGQTGTTAMKRRSAKKRHAPVLQFADETASGDEEAVRVGYLPQKPYAFRISVEKNLLLSSKERERADELIRSLQLEQLRSRRADKLSGGESARMALGRLLMRDYDLLILDEPTASMDVEMILSVEQVINEYRKHVGCPVLLITHSLQQAKRIADRVLFIHHGQLIEEGLTDQVLQNPESRMLKRFLQLA